LPLIADLKLMIRQLTTFAEEAKARAFDEDDAVALGQARAFRLTAEKLQALITKYTPAAVTHSSVQALIQSRAHVLPHPATPEVIRQQRDPSSQ
jgi:hypothetical protein